MDKKRIIATALTLFQLMPLLAFAQVQTLPPPPVQTPEDFIGILNYVVNFVFTLLMILALLFLLLAAFNYLTAMGSPEKIATARNMLIYTAVAIAIALIASGVRFMIASFLTRRA